MAPEKAVVRWPFLILSPLICGIPENAGVMQHFRPLVGPREGRGEVATFDFVPLCLRVPENAAFGKGVQRVPQPSLSNTHILAHLRTMSWNLFSKAVQPY